MFAHNIDCGYILEPPRRGSSNKYPLCFGSEIKKMSKNSHTPNLGTEGYNFQGRVFLMKTRSRHKMMKHKVHSQILYMGA